MAERYCTTCHGLRPVGHEATEHALALFGADAPIDVEPHTLARAVDPDTSHAAARMLSGKAGTMRRALLDAFSTADLTAEEAAEAAGYDPADGAWKRVSDLQNAKLIAPTGETRTASSGRQQRVMRISFIGRQAL